MRAEKFLKSVKHLSMETKALTGALETIKKEYEAVSGTNRVSDELLLRKNELQAEVSSRLAYIYKLKKELITAISRVKSEQERAVLTMYYVNNMTNEKIAEELCYDERSIYRIHKKATASLDAVLNG
ncbi:MAG: sigma-70 family RNA polymerase sigma factor [Clostridia bacterium]|nr:sigma-70 family RNA polymerase sigma factor [Clostridia bacterium]